MATTLLRRSISKFLKPNTRRISQFLHEDTCDCMNFVSKRVNRSDCTVSDKGLVLGIYHEDTILFDEGILTYAAEVYNERTNGCLARLLKKSPLPKLGETRVFYDLDPEYAFVAVSGLGSKYLKYNVMEDNDEGKEAIRVASAVGCRALQDLRPRVIDIESFGNEECAAEGALLAVWLFQEYKTHWKQVGVPGIELFDDHIPKDLIKWNSGRQKATAQNLARFLQEVPANIMTPVTFAKMTVELLTRVNINVNVKVRGWAEAHGMGGFVAVSRGSCEFPLFLEISYFGAGPKERPIVLIGKGVTFDSGGMNLKSCDDLRHMRGDMAGAACVVAVARAASLLNLPINIRGLIPITEHMPSFRNAKSGDVVRSPVGKHIRIRDTGLEGRLLIADALVYARSQCPKLVVDIGTMTKEMSIATGQPACGCFTNSENLFCKVRTASALTGDRIWRMPLWDYYSKLITNSNSIDLLSDAKNCQDNACTCAAFLNEHVCRDFQWVHLDTYGVMFSTGDDFPYLRRGMSGRPTRTLIELLYQLLKQDEIDLRSKC